ncbi:MAG TPA: amidohydrolase family protein [Anaeromyxobacteraceae bacterium]|nr:amidohydrolase family protein [Anaeromyxobacteraceae bacterium]
MGVRVLGAPWVLTGRATGPFPSGARPPPPVIRDGAVVLEGDRIRAIASRTDIEAAHGPVERLDAILFPALVNAHLHLELSHLRIPGGRGLASWIRLLVAARAEASDPGPALSAAVRGLHDAGVAAVCEVTNTLVALPLLAAAGLQGTIFQEVFGFSRARIEAALERAREIRAGAGSPPPGLRMALAPHAVYSTEPGRLAELLRAGPSSIHLAEDPAERCFCAHGTGPLAALARDLGAQALSRTGPSPVACTAPHLSPASLVVHAVDLSDEDVALISRAGATVVLCPRSNLHIGGRLADLPRLLAAAIPLAIGTDSLASSPSLSPLGELSALRHAFPTIEPARLLDLAWNGDAAGAPAIGRLLPGRSPGIVAADLAGARPDDPAAWLLDAFAAQEGPLAWISHPRL